MTDQHAHELDNPPATISQPVSQPQVVFPTEASDHDFPVEALGTIDVGSEETSFNVTAAQEGTRAKIALYFTYFFLTLVLISLVGPFALSLAAPDLITNPLEQAKELLTLVSGVLAGPFGFIMGFYFKQNQE